MVTLRDMLEPAPIKRPPILMGLIGLALPLGRMVKRSENFILVFVVVFVVDYVANYVASVVVNVIVNVIVKTDGRLTPPNAECDAHPN
jgi:hypothetical protein